jgi:hypothetical protein
MACIARCITGGDKITILHLQGPENENDRRKKKGLSCQASSFFARSTMIFSVITCIIAATSTSTLPKSFTQISQFIAYNIKDDAGEDSSAILTRLMKDNDLNVGAAGTITFLQSISLFASAKPASRKVQYMIDVVVNLLAGGLALVVFFKTMVDLPVFNSYCFNSIPGVEDNPSMHVGSPAYEAYCVGLMKRQWGCFILFGCMATTTCFAFLSNWCGVFCSMCLHATPQKKTEEENLLEKDTSNKEK